MEARVGRWGRPARTHISFVGRGSVPEVLVEVRAARDEVVELDAGDVLLEELLVLVEIDRRELELDELV